MVARHAKCGQEMLRLNTSGAVSFPVNRQNESSAETIRANLKFRASAELLRSDPGVLLATPRSNIDCLAESPPANQGIPDGTLGASGK
jgi:hypothetical protein